MLVQRSKSRHSFLTKEPFKTLHDKREELYELIVLKGCTVDEVAGWLEVTSSQLNRYIISTQLRQNVPYDFVSWCLPVNKFSRHGQGGDFSVGLLRSPNHEACFVIKASVFNYLVDRLGRDKVMEVLEECL